MNNTDVKILQVLYDDKMRPSGEEKGYLTVNEIVDRSKIESPIVVKSLIRITDAIQPYTKSGKQVPSKGYMLKDSVLTQVRKLLDYKS